MTEVTVGIAAKDAGPYLRDAVLSVLNQTSTDWKLILIDDGSTDSGVDRVAPLLDTRATLVRHDRSIGLAACLNELVDRAETPLFMRMDADDVMRPDRIEAQLEFLASRPDVDVVGSRAYQIDEHGVLMGLFGERSDPGTAATALTQIPFTHPTVVGRTKWFRRHRYSPQLRRAQDKDLWLRTIAESTFAKMPEPLLYYRVHSTTGNRSYREKSRIDRQLARRYGPAVIGRRPTWRIVMASYVKEGVYLAAQQVPSAARRIQSRRFIALDAESHGEAEALYALAIAQ